MENIEELKQANEKLTERLNNAAKFFREQKAQIEALTKEKEELEKKYKEQLDFEANNINTVVPQLEEKVTHLEEVIKSKDQAYNVLQNTYNELFGENTRNKEEIQNLIDQIKATEKTYDEEKKKIIEARDQWMGMAKELEKKSKEFEDKIKEQDKEYNKLNDTKEKLAKAYDNLENEKMAYASDYEILENKFKKLNDDYVSLENTKEVYSNSDNALKEIIAILNKHGFESSDEIKPKVEKKVSKTGNNPMNGVMIRMV